MTAGKTLELALQFAGTLVLPCVDILAVLQLYLVDYWYVTGYYCRSVAVNCKSTNGQQ